MKKTFKFTVLFVAIAAIAISCGSPKPQKTIDNLKAAIEGETTASETYQAYSDKAAEEGFFNISKMFAAASAAEAIHVGNHNAVLVELGEEEFYFTVGALTIKSTAENIQSAIEGETYEFTVMYPGFIADAEAENCEAAIESFIMARDSEATHARLYARALQALLAEGCDANVSSEWHVCPICGDLFDTIEGRSNCSICGNPASSFWKF